MIIDRTQLSDILALHKSVMLALNEQSDVKNIALANDIFGKFLIVSAASRLEEETKKTLREMVRRISGEPEGILLNFIEQNILVRSYHTLFDWNKNNANKFYALFGDKFRDFMRKKGDEDEEFANAARCFVALGRARNKLVHSDLAAVDFEWTEDDVEKRFRQAENFLPKFLCYALEFVREQTGEESPPAP